MTSDIFSICALVISVLGLAATYFGFVLKITNRQSDFETKIGERMAKVEANNAVFWQVLSPHMANIIHSPSHQERDELVDKLVHNVLTTQEAIRLVCMLEQNIKENGDSSKKLASAFLLARVEALIATGSLINDNTNT
jgi:hypothetical protein